jgi:hypothetical protein
LERVVYPCFLFLSLLTLFPEIVWSSTSVDRMCGWILILLESWLYLSHIKWRIWKILASPRSRRVCNVFLVIKDFIHPTSIWLWIHSNTFLVTISCIPWLWIHSNTFLVTISYVLCDNLHSSNDDMEIFIEIICVDLHWEF